jgi:LuxR family quorum-sensing system transcriptional regulator CciR
VEAYVERNIVANDPIHLASYRTDVGFTWDSVGRLIEVTSHHREMLADTRRAGIADGFTIPARVPDQVKGSFSFAVRCGRMLPVASLPAAQMIGLFGFEAARTMVLRSRKAAPPCPRPTLTPRQLDCMVLVARGKTDWEISRILGVHEQTVTQHINEARLRSGASRRTQLIVDALYRGDLSFRDIYREVSS